MPACALMNQRYEISDTTSTAAETTAATASGSHSRAGSNACPLEGRISEVEAMGWEKFYSPG